MGVYAEVNIFGDIILDNQGKSNNKSQNQDKNSKKIDNVENKNGSGSIKRKLNDNLTKEHNKKLKIEETSSKQAEKSIISKSSSKLPVEKSSFKIPKLSDKLKKPESKEEKSKERLPSKRDEKSQIIVKSKVCESKNQNNFGTHKNQVPKVSEKSKDQKKESSTREEVKKSLSSSKLKGRNENVSQRVEKLEKEKSLKPKEDLKKIKVSSSSKVRPESSQKSEKPKEKSEKVTRIVKSKEDNSSKKSDESSKKIEPSKLKNTNDNENQKSQKSCEDSEKLKKIVQVKSKSDKDSEKSKKLESSKSLKDVKIPKASKVEITKEIETSKIVKSEESSPKNDAPKTETPELKSKVINKTSQITPISGGKLSNFWKMYESMNHEEEFSSSESESSEEESEDEIHQEVQTPKDKLILKINTSALKVEQKLEEKVIENSHSNVIPMEVQHLTQPKEIAPKVEDQPMEVEEVQHSTQSAEVVPKVESQSIESTIPQIDENHQKLEVIEHPKQNPEVAQSNLSENLEKNFSNSKPAKKRVEHRQSFNGISTDFTKLNGITTKVQNQEGAQKNAEPIRGVISRHSLGESNEVRRRIQKAAENAKVQLFGLPRQFDVNDLNDQWSRDLEVRLRKLPNILDLSRKSDSFLQLPHNIAVSPQYDIPQQFINSREGYKTSQPIQNQPSKKQKIVECKPKPVDFIPKPVDSKPQTVQVYSQSDNMETKLSESLTAEIQNQSRPVNKVQPVVRPLKQIKPAARPEQQIQPVSNPVKQKKSVIRPAFQIQPFVRPGHQLKPYIKPVQLQKRPLPQSKRPDHPVQAPKRPALQIQQETKPVYEIPIPIKPVHEVQHGNQIKPPTNSVNEVQSSLDEQALSIQQKLEKMKKVFNLDSKKKKEPVKKNSNQKRLLNIGKIKTSVRKESLAKLAQKKQEVQKKPSPTPNKTEEVLAKVDTLLNSPDMVKLAEAIPEVSEKVQIPEMPILLNDLEVSDDSDSDDSDSDDSDDSDSNDSDDSESSESSSSSSEEEIDNFASQIETLLWGN